MGVIYGHDFEDKYHNRNSILQQLTDSTSIPSQTSKSPFVIRTGFNLFFCKIHNFYIIKNKISPIEIYAVINFGVPPLVATTLLFPTV